MEADERLAEIRGRLDTERAETIARRPTDYPYPMDTWWEADLKWCLTHIAELEKLVPQTVEQCAQITFDTGYRLAAVEEAGSDEQTGIRITEAIAAATLRHRRQYG